MSVWTMAILTAVVVLLPVLLMVVFNRSDEADSRGRRISRRWRVRSGTARRDRLYADRPTKP